MTRSEKDSSASSQPVHHDRSPGNWQRLSLAIVLIAGAVVMIWGITWGMPGRQADEFLFIDDQHEPWTGEQIDALTGPRAAAPDLGSDVDANPLEKTDTWTVVNSSDAQRAEIVRRYRLFTYHPDEMVTFMALAQMNPSEGRLDPGLYQYGGLWVYSIGGVLKLASLVGLADVRADLTYYLDHPDAFGRFYVLARLFSAAWALVGGYLVFRLIWRLTDGSSLASAIGAMCFFVMPVVVTSAHEAKPHLAGCALMLMTILTSMRFVQERRTRWWVATCIIAGLSVGMVLTAWPVISIVICAGILGWHDWKQRSWRIAGGMLIAMAVYFATNPYVLINAIIAPDRLISNLSNTQAMFAASDPIATVIRAWRLLAEGASMTVALLGTAGAVMLGWQWHQTRRRHESARASAAWLLTVPAALVLVPFFVFAGGQDAAYARFALFGDIALLIAAIVAIHRVIPPHHPRQIVLILLLCSTALPGWMYIRSFHRDATGVTSRIVAAAQLEKIKRTYDVHTLGILAEPAPYCMPPFDLFNWEVRLLSKDLEIDPDNPPADVIVMVSDLPTRFSKQLMSAYNRETSAAGTDVRITWADRAFQILIARRVTSTDASR
jgi:hypothetical protein